MPLMERLSGTHGVGPVCRELDIAPSTYYWHQQRRAHPGKCSQREKRDAQISREIKRIYEENYCVYGARKVWRQLLREGFHVARCTVERLMKIMGLRGCASRQGHQDDAQPQNSSGSGSGAPSVRGRTAQPALVCRFYLRQHLAGLRVCGVHHRCVRRHDRWMAGLIINGDNVRPGFPGAGAVGPSPCGNPPSQR
jgi:hypothetical protein